MKKKFLLINNDLINLTYSYKTLYSMYNINSISLFNIFYVYKTTSLIIPTKNRLNNLNKFLSQYRNIIIYLMK